MEVEKPETPLGLRIAAPILGIIVALLVLRWIFGLIRWLFTVAVIVALVMAVMFVVRTLKPKD